jgi:hypothetical protein
MRKLLLVAGGVILVAFSTITVSGCGNTPCGGDGGVKTSWQIQNTIYYICNDNTTQEVYIGGGGGGGAPQDDGVDPR